MLSGTDPRTKVTRPAIGRGYCDARNIFIPKVRIVSPAATTCTKDRPPGVAPLRIAFYIFHFRDEGAGKGQEGHRSQKHYKTQFPGSTAGAIFRASERRGWLNARRAFNAFSARHQSVTAREHKGKESLVSVTQNGFHVINASKRTLRNHGRISRGRHSGHLLIKLLCIRTICTIRKFKYVYVCVRYLG